MCKVTIDVWICPVCRKAHESFDRPNSWECCDVGPTYDKSCPNFAPNLIRHYEYFCDDCKAMHGVLEEVKSAEGQEKPPATEDQK